MAVMNEWNYLWHSIRRAHPKKAYNSEILCECESAILLMNITVEARVDSPVLIRTIPVDESSNLLRSKLGLLPSLLMRGWITNFKENHSSWWILKFTENSSLCEGESPLLLRTVSVDTKLNGGGRFGRRRLGARQLDAVRLVLAPDSPGSHMSSAQTAAPKRTRPKLTSYTFYSRNI